MREDEGHNPEKAESIRNELNNTFTHNLNSRNHIRDRAATILSADLVLTGLVTGLAGSQQATLLIFSGIISIIVSIYYCAQTLTSNDRYIGLNPKGAKEALEMGSKAYYNKLALKYEKWIDRNNKVKKDMTKNLNRSIWAAFAGLLFFATSAFPAITKIDTYPILDIVSIIIIPVLSYYGRERTKFLQESRRDKKFF
ncbi:hypothetical protein [Halorussus caseinilyticus]|uniref:Uncharacterized protein n=1 Tax=Halorussus caseinilyticus TaxID=3034025 RepID=A0ABD5WKI6_9EURY|nr:hypothetical protein [Halorussus sp. DT72]